MPRVRGSNPLASNQAGASRHARRSNDSNGNKLETSSSSSLAGSEWEETRCPICMEFPHNAVLLICSSREKGCRPYMCDTSYRHSNCFDQFCKSSQVTVSSGPPNDESVARIYDDKVWEGESGRLSMSNGSLRRLGAGLVCPLCRGQVFGFAVIEAGRKYLNSKMRSCSLESCEFTGNYAELRKHARCEHPTLIPSEADAQRQSDWVRLEQQSDLGDTLSAHHSPLVPELTEEDVLFNALVQLENFSVNVPSVDDGMSDQFSAFERLQSITTNWPLVNDDLFEHFFSGIASETEDDVPSVVGTSTVDMRDAVEVEFAFPPFDELPLYGDIIGPGDENSNPGIASSSHGVLEVEFSIPSSSNGVVEIEFDLSPYFSLNGERMYPRINNSNSGFASHSNGVVEFEFAFSPLDDSPISGNILRPRDDDSNPGIAGCSNGAVEVEVELSRPPFHDFSLYGEPLCPRDDDSNSGIASSSNGVVELEYAFSPMDDSPLSGGIFYPMDSDSNPGIASSSNGEAVVEYTPFDDFSVNGDILCPRDDDSNPGVTSSRNGAAEVALSPLDEFSPYDAIFRSRADDSNPVTSSYGGLFSTTTALSPLDEFSPYDGIFRSRDNDSNPATSSYGDLFSTTTEPRTRSSNRREETIRPRHRRARHRPYSSSRHSSGEGRR